MKALLLSRHREKVFHPAQRTVEQNFQASPGPIVGEVSVDLFSRPSMRNFSISRHAYRSFSFTVSGFGIRWIAKQLPLRALANVTML